MQGLLCQISQKLSKLLRHSDALIVHINGLTIGNQTRDARATHMFLQASYCLRHQLRIAKKSFKYISVQKETLKKPTFKYTKVPDSISDIGNLVQNDFF
jgi:hypothetical protein